MLFFARLMLPIIWMGVIFFFSSLPHLRVDMLGIYDLILRKLAHFFEYLVLSLLFMNFFAKDLKWGRGRFLFWSIFLSIVYSVLDEYHQSYVPGRCFSLIDIFIDSSGASSSLIFRRILLRGI